jgi:seryl-tRNA synthetase
MLDIKLIRENPEFVRKNLQKRKKEDYLDMFKQLINKDRQWRELKIQVDQLRRKRNDLTKQIQHLKKNGNEENIKKIVFEAKKIPKKIKELEELKKKIEEEKISLLLRIPNLLHKSVPYGEGDEGNEIVQKWGEKPKFHFTPKSHVDLIEILKLADIERAAKTSGARFYYLENELVELEFALIFHAIKILKKRGFSLIIPPTLVKGFVMEGGGFLPTFRQDVYKIQDEDLFLAGTSEAPLIGMHSNEIFYENDFPIRYAGFSTCYRTEAGAHGKDTKGIFRTHHFEKVEQISITSPNNSWKEHDYLFETAELFWQSLGIPYQKVNICTGDIGIVAAKKYDLETWYPAQQKYRELVSTSNCTDYQARRLKIRYREKDGMPTKICHTLNSTLIAIQRGLTCILENYQNDDGSIRVPKVLQKYVDFKEITKK